MTTPELIKFIQEKLAAGYSKQEITAMLTRNGWEAKNIAEGFDMINRGLGKVSPQVNQKFQTPAGSSGKKLTVSLGLIMASVFYAFYQSVFLTSPSNLQIISVQAPATNTNPDVSTSAAPTQTSAPVAATTPVQTKTPAASPAQTVKKPAPTPTPVAVAPAPTPVQPAPKPKGEYTDGTYTGSPANAYYGTIQVQATIQGGRLTNVQFLQYPNDRGTSVRINSYADPQLAQEAISAQSANVDVVSGATDSSQAFQQSLATALSEARA